MSLLEIAEARRYLTTALADPDLQLVIDREEAEVARRFGGPYVDAETTISETHPGGERNLYLRRGVTAVSSVSERLDHASDPETLAADDYFVWADEGRLERLPAGTRWGVQATVVYVPADDNARRKAAVVELVRLALERTALKSESVAGEYSYQAPDWETARAEILRGLGFWRA